MLPIDWREDWLLKKAEDEMRTPVRGIGDAVSDVSPGTPNDYFSQADYWWPDPNQPDGLPFVQRDGESYPGAFFEHRRIMRRMRTAVAHLAAGYRLTGDGRYAKRASEHLEAFFLDEERKMNPHMLYTQAILGRCTGRGIGVIDTLHLIDIPAAVSILEGKLAGETMRGLKAWFREYLTWMTTHPYGIDERNTGNNHTICYFVQLASFAGFVGDDAVLDDCAANAQGEILKTQMNPDGSFERELRRTKPYGYSIFVLDNLCTLYHLLPGRVDWNFSLPDGRGVRRGVEFLLPYLENKSAWPLKPDVEHFDGWPARASFMPFAGAGLNEDRLLRLYNALPNESHDDEVRRNLGVRVPFNWM